MSTDAVFDAHGSSIDADRLARMIAASGERDERGRPLLRDVRFEGATFEDPVSFAGVAFGGEARFDGAHFAQEVSFEHALFAQAASFDNAVFVKPARFTDTTFAGSVSFDDAEAHDGISFTDTLFGERASFGGELRDPHFSGNRMFAGARLSRANFAYATFEGDQLFVGALFEADATFTRASFKGEYPFFGAAFAGVALFNGARFDGLRSFGPVLVAGMYLGLYRASFTSLTRVDVSASTLFADQTQFLAGGELRVAAADISFDAARFAGPSLVVGVSTGLGDMNRELLKSFLGAPVGPSDAPCFAFWDREEAILQRSPREPPRIVSLRGAVVGGVTLSNVDLGACRFAGALGLDGMRIEPTCGFASMPKRRYSQRDVIAEELEWRSEREQQADGDAIEGRGLGVPAPQSPSGLLDAPEPLRPGQIASIYRQLRKAREDAKDQPGAADFYYGEMEMRRHSPPGTRSGAGARLKSRGEHVLLWLYWLTSGYGLRASRALAALAVTVVLFSALLYLFGLKSPDVGTALLQSTEGATLRSGDREVLTGAGKGLQLALRLLGPLFFGLALLSLRGRIQR
jgi:uncharacterized protein YjbI with pentapeptide repeats